MRCTRRVTRVRATPLARAGPRASAILVFYLLRFTRREEGAGGGGSRRREARTGTRLRPSRRANGPAGVPATTGGCPAGGGDVIYFFSILLLSSSERCARPPYPPRTSPRHLACTPGVHGHPARTHDAAPPAQRTRATCLTTPEHARPSPTQVRSAGGDEQPLQVATARARARARRVHVAGVPAFRVP